jgi:sugar/nucleoside kinase (ribokinase family)
MAKGVFVGLSTIDLVYEVDEFPVGDSKITARSQSVFVGGPAANAAIAFRHLGGDATLVTVVGRHPLAGLIHEELARYSIRLIDLNRDFEGLPVLSAVVVNQAGQRNVVSANASGMTLPSLQIDSAVITSSSILLVDGHFMQASQAWADAARRSEVRVVLDGGSWKDGMDALLRSVDTAICSADFRIPEHGETTQLIDFLKSRGVANIAITAGSKPILWATQTESGLVPVPQVSVVDTMGAGDILHGAFCWYAAQGQGFPEALERAVAVASESCRFSGTRGWMQSTPCTASPSSDR